MAKGTRNGDPKFPARVAKPVKRAAGRAGVAATPLDLRVRGVGVDPELQAHMRERVASKLGRFATHIERIAVRFADLNGPRGGVDTTCRIQVAIPAAPLLLFEHRAIAVRESFDGALGGIARLVRRELDRLGRGEAKPARSGEKPTGRTAGARSKKAHGRAEAFAYPPPPDGSLIGGRVGRGRANLLKAAERPEKKRRDVGVDTAAPGRSASDRRAGGGSTAARNTKLNTSRATAALEDSAQDRPSRKSTRKSHGRAKRDADQRLQAVTETHSPAGRHDRR